MKTCVLHLLTIFVSFFAISIVGVLAQQPILQNGKIVFSSDRSGSYQLYTMDANGSNVQRLTYSDSDDTYPKWSPDGTKIAFQSNRDSALGIYTINEDGSGLTTLNNDNARYPSWSPDGTKIVYTKRTESDGDIYTINMDGTGISQLIDGNDEVFNLHPIWSPDGSKILFVRTSEITGVLSDNSPSFDLMIYDIATGSEIKLYSLDTEGNVDWSSVLNEGELVLYDDGLASTTILRLNDDGSSLTGLDVTIEPDPFSTDVRRRDMFPSWSPDGSMIVFSSSVTSPTEPGNIDFDILVTAIDDSILVNLTLDSNANDIMPDWQPILQSCDINVIVGDTVGLISAINSANANPDATSICLASGTYTFTAANNSTNALPLISSEITILGNGATLVRSSSSNFRFFTVNSGGHLTLENITLTGGSVGSQYGGALHINGGQLTLNNATIHQNIAKLGGGIYGKNAVMTINNSHITDNYGSSSGGGIYNLTGSLTVDQSFIQDNTINGSGDNGGGIASTGSSVTANITNNVISGNYTRNDGAGIWHKYGTLIATNNQVIYNDSNEDASGFFIVSVSNGGVQNNTIAYNYSRVSSGGLGVKDTTLPIHYNCIYGNTGGNPTGIKRFESKTVNAENNWWGASDGPRGNGPGSGDGVSGSVDYTPFLTSSDPTGCVIVGPQTATLLAPEPANSEFDLEISRLQTSENQIPELLDLDETLWFESPEPTGRMRNKTILEYALSLDLSQYTSPHLEIPVTSNLSGRNALVVEVALEDETWQPVSVVQRNGMYQIDLSAFTGNSIWLRVGIPSTSEKLPANSVQLIEG